jgi:hypothetical protein
MADRFDETALNVFGPATRHYAITAADSDLAVRPRALYVLTDGDLVLRDEQGTDITYPVTAGSVLTIRAIQVRAASTATVVGWD